MLCTCVCEFACTCLCVLYTLYHIHYEISWIFAGSNMSTFKTFQTFHSFGYQTFGQEMLSIYFIRYYTVHQRGKKQLFRPNVKSDAVRWPFSRKHTIFQLTLSFSSKSSLLKELPLFIYSTSLLNLLQQAISASVTLFSALGEQVNPLIDFKCCWLQVMRTLLIYIYYLYSYSVLSTF